MRQLAIILACPLFEDMDHASLLESLCSLLVGLSSWMQQVWKVWGVAPCTEGQCVVPIVIVQHTGWPQQLDAAGVDSVWKVWGVGVCC